MAEGAGREGGGEGGRNREAGRQGGRAHGESERRAVAEAEPRERGEAAEGGREGGREREIRLGPRSGSDGGINRQRQGTAVGAGAGHRLITRAEAARVARRRLRRLGGIRARGPGARARTGVSGTRARTHLAAGEQEHGEVGPWAAGETQRGTRRSSCCETLKRETMARNYWEKLFKLLISSDKLLTETVSRSDERGGSREGGGPPHRRARRGRHRGARLARFRKRRGARGGRAPSTRMERDDSDGLG